MPGKPSPKMTHLVFSPSVALVRTRMRVTSWMCSMIAGSAELFFRKVIPAKQIADAFVEGAQ